MIGGTWLILGAMVLVALLFVLPPLLRGSARRTPSQAELNVAVHRTRLAELEADLAGGRLSAEQFELAKQDLERDLLADVAATANTAGTQTAAHPARWTAAAIAVLMPVLALGLYYELGGWRDIGADPHAQLAAQDRPATQGTGNSELPPVQELVAKLEARLKAQPEDAKGWAMLGQTYVYLNRYADAAQAYGQAYALSGEEVPGLLVDYAEAMALANGENLAGAPTRLIERALKAEPDNQKGLWLAGMAAFQRQDFPAAIDHWERLAKMTPPDSQEAGILQSYIQQAKAGGGAPATAPAAEAPAATTSEAPATAEVPAASAGAGIRVQVSLDAGLAAQAAPDDTVFVFARAAQGPRMPLAIVRKQVRDLPVEVTLDDSQAMMPAMKLSNFPEVVVGARVSKTGNAMPSSGDLQGDAGTVATGRDTRVQVTIDEVVP